jgi:hypothetical protein
MSVGLLSALAPSSGYKMRRKQGLTCEHLWVSFAKVLVPMSHNIPTMCVLVLQGHVCAHVGLFPGEGACAEAHKLLEIIL